MNRLRTARAAGRRPARITTVATLLAMLGGIPVASAQNEGPVCDGATGHCYEYVVTGLFWDDAKVDAFSRTYAGMPGHLTTITTAGEQAFIEMTFPGQKGWMGGFQPPSSASEADPAAGWQWVTGEPFALAQWGCGQPDDFRDGGFPEGEDYMEMKLDPCLEVSQWNDAPGFFPNAYFIEYEPVTDLVDSLGDQVAGLPAVNDGQRNVLSRLLNNATRNVESGDDAGAIDKLLSFINFVNAQRGKSIGTADADRLIEAAEVIINGIVLV